MRAPGENKGGAAPRVLAFLMLYGIACGAPTAPSEYKAVRITPREILVAQGAMLPLRLTFIGLTANGAADTLSPQQVEVSIVDTTRAVLKADSISGRVFGSTFLRAKVRSGGRTRPADSIPVFVFRVG